MSTSRHWWTAAIVTGALATGCGGDDEPTGSPDPGTEAADDTSSVAATDSVAEPADTEPAGGEPTTPDDPAPAEPTGAPADELAALDACSLLTVEEVTALFGQPARIDSPSATTASADCVWLGDESGLHQLHLQLYTGASFYGPTRWAGTPEEVSGLGDEAFVIRSSPLGATAGFRAGEQVAFLNYQILLSGDSVGERADQLVELLRLAAGRTGSAPAAPAASESAGPCALITADDVAAVHPSGAPEPDESSFGSGFDECVWEGDTDAVLRVSVVPLDAWHADYADQLVSSGSIAELGDDALSFDGVVGIGHVSSGGATAAFTSGDAGYLVAVRTGDGSNAGPDLALATEIGQRIRAGSG